MDFYEKKSSWKAVLALPLVFLMTAEPLLAQTAKKEYHKRRVGDTDLITTGSIVRMFSEGDGKLRGSLSTEGDADFQVQELPDLRGTQTEVSSTSKLKSADNTDYVHDATRPDPRQLRVQFRTVGDLHKKEPEKSAMNEIINAIKGGD